MCSRASFPSSDISSRSRDGQRRRGGSGALDLFRLELIAMLVVSSYSKGKPLGPTTVTAFRACPPRMSSTKIGGSNHVNFQEMDVASLKAARALVAHEASGSRRLTKKALFESIGYGVMDPMAYQTFENSPLPPKLRPTTHVRVAEGIHSFGQEFLGVPPTEGISLFSESAAPASVVALDSSTTTAGGSPYFELHPKLPGLGMRMTVLRLGSGELLVHSPLAPTVELLDMLRNSFPAIGPTSKVHLFSSSLSPEHWAFLKHWKDIFPSAEVWAVPGPHRRLMGVEVNHDIEHESGVPEQLGGEMELAVLEGVPMVREALLLHRPTGVVLSADLLLAMDQNTIAQGATDGTGQQRKLATPATLSSASSSSRRSPASPLKPRRFGEQSGSLAAVETMLGSDPVKGGRWRRLRWVLLDKTASLLDMNTLAVFAPVKTLMHAFKGNSHAFSSRVLSWDAKVLVACHGQSPLEGPELKGMLHAALGRYVKPAKDKFAKKRIGTRLLTLIPGRNGDQKRGNPGDASTAELREPGHFSGVGNRFSSGGGVGLGDGGGGDPFVIDAVSRPGVEPKPEAGSYSSVAMESASGSSARPAVTPAASTKDQTTSASPTKTSVDEEPAGEGKSRKVEIAGVSASRPSTSYRTNVDHVQEERTTMAKKSMTEAEARARRYVQVNLKDAGAAGAVAPLPPASTSPKPKSGEVFGKSSKTLSPEIESSTRRGKRKGGRPGYTPGKGKREPSSTLGDENAGETAVEDSLNPFVGGGDSRYDEGPAGPIGEDQDDDPFEAPFYPFNSDVS